MTVAVSIQEQVVDGVRKALAGMTEPKGLTVQRETNTSIKHFPTLVVFDDGGRLIERVLAHAQYRIALTIEGYVSAEKPAEAGSKLTDLYARTISALYEDVTLGGIALDIYESDRAVERVTRDGGVEPHMVFILRIEVEFFTLPDDPFTAA